MRTTLCAVALFAWSGSVPAQAYKMTELGTLPGTSYSYGTAINASGAATGISGADAFISGPNGGTLIDIGKLAGSLGSIGQAVNAAAQVTGYADVGGANHAFITGANGAGIRVLAALPGTLQSVGVGVNAAGQVAGYARLGPQGAWHAFITGPQGIGITDLGSLRGVVNVVSTGINTVGQVVGYLQIGGGYNQQGGTFEAFITGPNGRGIIPIGELPGGVNSLGLAINTSGQVTGYASTATQRADAFVTGANGAGMIDIGALVGATGSTGLAINDHGQVAGYSGGHAFVYDGSGGGMKDLNGLIDPALAAHVTLQKATGINDGGQILADGVDGASGAARAYLLSPNSVPQQLAQLQAEVTGVGPGNSLGAKVGEAQADYAASDYPATCAVLGGFVSEVEAQDGKKISQAMAGKFIYDARAIEAAIACK